MENRFFISALSAAKKGPEAFAKEFENIEANANIKELSSGSTDFGENLIHRLIMVIPDETLPAILTILIRHQVDLESVSETSGCKPLALAANSLKKNAVVSLIEHKAEINDPKSPALCEVMKLSSECDEIKRLDIVKILLQHKAKIDIQDRYEKSPLYSAAEDSRLEIMQLLISHDANLHLKYTYARGTQNHTALSIAYYNYILAIESYKEYTHKTVTHMRNCLLVLIEAAEFYSYRQGVLCTRDEKELIIYLREYVSDLAGHFAFSSSGRNNSIELKNLLRQEIIFPVLTRVKTEREQLHAFRMGSQLSAKQKLRGDSGSAIYRFFQKAGERDILPIIFSYVHEVTPHAIKSTL